MNIKRLVPRLPFGKESEMPNLPLGYPFFTTDTKKFLIGLGADYPPISLDLSRVGLFGTKKINEENIAHNATVVYNSRTDELEYVDIDALVRSIIADAGNSVPSGAVSFFAMSIAPDGWLECDGREVQRDVYPKLFSAIGETYGAGDGTTTFMLPDLRGEFIRGWDNGKGIDAGRSFGSSQPDEFKEHTHRIQYTETSLGSGEEPWSFDSGPGFQSIQYQTTSETGGVETRPRNIALLPCIKY